MPNLNEEEIIDLTSLEYIPQNDAGTRTICDNACDIIDLANDSFDNGNITCVTYVSRKRKKSTKVQEDIQIQKSNESNDEGKAVKFGHCSICWDKLGKNPLASTKCGHVYCFKCLENSLKHDKRCPTCRRILKGSSAYHPLYLELG